MPKARTMRVHCSQGHYNVDSQSFCGTCGEPLTQTGRSVPSGAAVPEADRPVGAAAVDPAKRVGEETTAAVGADRGHLDAAHSDTPSPVPQVEPSPPRRRRRKLLVIGTVLSLVGAGAGVAVLTTQGGPNTEDQYIAALAEANLSDEFPTDRAAVIAAEGFCEEFDRTGDPKGTDAARLAVAHYCPEFEKDFRLLRTKRMTGGFAISDYDAYWLSAGDPCEGEGGYSDVNSSTAVVITNLAGDKLARTSLGPGRVVSYACKFSFYFRITEGEEQYIVSVGDRGEASYTYDEVSKGRVQLSLGG